ncbi:MAG TPA: hypothetical protein VNM92_03535 [Thermoanaerobaculia bacterium]|nr:hypothetical protein [Thermoanaerobaculia bacterium]
MLRLFTITTLALALAGCGTISRSGSDAIPVKSVPSGATVDVICDGKDRFQAVTPANVALRRRSNDCFFSFTHDGYEPARVYLTRRAPNGVEGPGRWVARATPLAPNTEGVSVDAIFEEPTVYDKGGISVTLQPVGGAQ